MHRPSLALSLALIVFSPAATFAGGPSTRPAPTPVGKRVWTSEEVEALRERGLISLVGPERPAEGLVREQPPAAETRFPRISRPVRAQDPEWYADQAAQLRAAIEFHGLAIRRVRQSLRNARYWEGGINLAVENSGITPESELALLAARNFAELDKLDALADQARRNEIPPGALR